MAWKSCLKSVPFTYDLQLNLRSHGLRIEGRQWTAFYHPPSVVGRPLVLMIRILTVTMGVIRTLAVMVCIPAFYKQTSLQFVPSFVEKSYHALSGGLVKDRSHRL